MVAVGSLYEHLPTGRSETPRQGAPRNLVLEGLNSGDPIPVNAEFWTELKREAMAKLEGCKKTGND
jgi:hypothetical protein